MYTSPDLPENTLHLNRNTLSYIPVWCVDVWALWVTGAGEGAPLLRVPTRGLKDKLPNIIRSY